MEEMRNSGSKGWELFNTVLGAGALATALGVGIPALNKSSKSSSNEEKCSDNTAVNRFELRQSQRISELESQSVTDTKILDTYKALVAQDEKQNAKFAQLTKELTDYIIANNREVDNIKCEAKSNTLSINDNLRFLDYKIDNNQREMFAYVDCKTLPLEKKLPLSSVCPTPLAGSTPIVANPQVITTTTATTEGEVSLNAVRVASK